MRMGASGSTIAGMKQLSISPPSTCLNRIGYENTFCTNDSKGFIDRLFPSGNSTVVCQRLDGGAVNVQVMELQLTRSRTHTIVLEVT